MRISRIGMLAAMVGIMVFSLGAPAWGSTGLDGPNPPEVGDPVAAAAQNEKQLISMSSGVIAGTFTLSYTDGGGTCTTTSLAFNSTAAQVDAAVIEGALASTACTAVFADADIVATGGPINTAAITLEFQGAFANTNVNQWSASGSSLGSSKYIYVSTIQNGRWAGGNDGAVAPATDGIDPHGGYSAATNYCLQCHAVHSYDPDGPGGSPAVGPGEYALLARDSVTDTCNTCHKIFGAFGAGGRINSNAITGASLEIGTSSVRTAYDVPAAAGTSQHTLGTDSSPLPDGVEMKEIGWRYGSFNALNWYLDAEAAGAGTSHPTDNAGVPADTGNPGGLYCGSCHTPHGEFGQVINASKYRSNAGADALSAVQYVFVEGLVSGDSWHLTFNGVATSPDFAWDAPTATVATALGNVPGIDTVTVAGTPLSATNTVGNYSITFTGTSANTTQPQLEGVVVSGAGTVEVVTSQGGSAAVTEDTAGNSANGTLAATRTFGDDKPIFQYNQFNRPQVYYLNAMGDTTTGGGLATSWERCTSTDGSTTVPSAAQPTGCEPLTLADAEGQIVYEYGYKLLTAYPNHNWLKAESWGLAYRGTDSARWCASCHTSKASGDFGVEGEYAVGGVTYHTHPTACYYCHGNPTDGGSYDFPHTSSNGQLLKEYPDALCISCHRAGTLP